MNVPLSPAHGVTPAQELLARIYERREVVDSAGQPHRLHSEVTPDEGDLISSLILKHNFTRTLEVGCAYGLSALHVCHALSGQPRAHHTMIDPGQFTEWRGIGVHQLSLCGFSSYTLIEQPSELALPKLLEEQRTFEFAVIDGWHTFDHTLLDFFYVNRLLEVGGIFVVDDLQLPAIRKVARYVTNYPNYKVVGAARQSHFKPSMKRRLATSVLSRVARLMPESFAEEVFAPTLFLNDYDRELTGEMVAFQKIGDDARDSHWFRRF